MPLQPADAAGRLMGDLAATVLWPLVAIVLVLCGATFATSGRTAQPQRPSPDDRPRAGRRATDHLPGNRMLVVIAGGDSHDTVRSAIGAARRASSGVTVVGDVSAAARTYDRLGAVPRDSQVIAVNSRD